MAKAALKNILNRNVNNLNELEAKSEVFKEVENLDEATENETENVSTIQSTVSPVSSKNKDKHLDFINNILIKASNENRGTIYTSKITHNRLKMLSAYTNINIFDLTDSIINDFFERNKSNIETLRKKSSF